MNATHPELDELERAVGQRLKDYEALPRKERFDYGAMSSLKWVAGLIKELRAPP